MKKIFLSLFLSLMFVLTPLAAFEHLSLETIDKKIEKGKFIIDFYAIWCPPCTKLAKNLEEFDKVKKVDLTIFKVDIDKQRELMKKYNVKSIPTLVYVKDGKVLATKRGKKSVEQLQENVKKYFN